MVIAHQNAPLKRAATAINHCCLDGRMPAAQLQLLEQVGEPNVLQFRMHA